METANATPAARRELLIQELRAAVRLATPVALVQLGLMLMGVVDTMMLGRLSARALAAGALGHLATIPFLIFGSGTLAALDPLVAQAYGAGDARGIRDHLQRGVVLALGLAVPFCLALWDVGPLLRLLGQPPEVVADAALYARAVLWGLPGFLLFIAFRQTLQAMSIVRPAMVAIVLGNLTNVVANYGLIFGHFGLPALGVEGSAYATSICRTAMLAYLVWAGRRAIAPYWHGLTREAFRLAGHARLLRLGVPIGLHQSIELVVFVTVAVLMGRMGVAALAGHQIAINLASLSFMVPLGISGAAATRVGNAIGRGDLPAARRAAAVSLVLGGAVMLVFAALFGLFPEELARAYTADSAVIALAAALLPIAAVFQVFDGVQAVAAGILRGVADTTLPAALALVGFWVLGLPAGWYLAFPRGQGAPGLWWGLSLGLAVVAVLYLARVRAKLRRPVARVEERAEEPPGHPVEGEAAAR
jgi:multidrug resistance protein, MATE family